MTQNTYGYVAIYNGRRYECFAPDLHAAKLKAIEAFNAPKSKQHLIAIMLAEVNGEPYLHSGASL